MAERVRRVLVIGADNALFDLIEEWLSSGGYHVATECANHESAPDGIDLVVVDIPFPRQGGTNSLRRIAADYPGVPILALSSTFFSGVESDGTVARALGVSAVLPKPVKRDALIASVMRLIPRSP